MPILKSSVSAVVTIADADLHGEEFQTITGGEVTADSVKDRPPGSRYESAITGPPTVSNVIVGRSYHEERDGALLSKLYAAVGTSTGTIGRVRRDAKGNQTGTTTYGGVLVRVASPEGDTNDSSAKAMLELEFNVDGGPA